jgi:stage III sporulation protein AB
MLITGCLVLIIGCGCLGLLKATQIKKRPKEIREMINALTLLDTEIYWGVTPLPAAFHVLKERTDSPWKEFFAGLEERLNGGETAYTAWRRSIAEIREKACLDDEDWKIIEGIGKNLGRSDRNEEHKHLELGKKHLAALYEKASSQADMKAKMWSYLGFLGGAAIAIFIM